jgi:arylsulfatase A-like enzyme
MHNKLILLLLLVVIVGCKEQSTSTEIQKISETKAITEKPNIIVILTDDQGWADVGFNGGTDIPTPNLDIMADEGVVFSNGYVSHPYCSPSRAGLLTGRYQARFGHDCNMPYNVENDETVGTPLSEKMISEALKEQGYRTSAIGKWHVGDHPSLHPPAQGFDHWFGFPGGGMNYWGVSKGPLQTIFRNGVKVPENELTYLTDDFTDEAIRFINDKDDKPFFMYLAYNAPHAPDHATKQYLENTKHIEYAGRSIYGAMVNAVDAGVGKIDSTLVANGMRDNTIVVFLSDNGGRGQLADNRPNRGYKGMLFEGGIKVPFFISWPNGIEGHKVYNKNVSSLDLFPTFLDAIGEDYTKETQLDGVSLLPYLSEEKTSAPHNILFWRSVGGYEYAVRKGNYKLYKNASKEKTMLFDLDNDSYERHDIAEQYPVVVEDLEKEYKNWDEKNIPPGWLDPHIPNCIKDQKKWEAEREKSINKNMISSHRRKA